MLKKVWHKNGARIRVWSTIPEGKPRGDLCLPVVYLTVGILCVIFGAVACIIAIAAEAPAVMLFVGLLCVPAGILSILEWKNRTIRMCPVDMFEYTNLFGRKRVYSFADVSQIKRGFFSTKLILEGRSIAINSDAIVSERLQRRLDALNHREDL